jgi:hypothetical protein
MPHVSLVQELDDGQVGQRAQLLQVVLLEGLQEDGLRQEAQQTISAVRVEPPSAGHAGCMRAGAQHECHALHLLQPPLAVELAAVAPALDHLQQWWRHIVQSS